MSVSVSQMGKAPLLLAGREITSASTVVEALLQIKAFFTYPGSMKTLEKNVITGEWILYSDTRLSIMPNPIMVTTSWLAIHTQESRFSWSLDEPNQSIKINCIPHVCVVEFCIDGRPVTETTFMRFPA